jgi:hypothetical protein
MNQNYHVNNKMICSEEEFLLNVTGFILFPL